MSSNPEPSSTVLYEKLMPDPIVPLGTNVPVSVPPNPLSKGSTSPDFCAGEAEPARDISANAFIMKNLFIVLI